MELKLLFSALGKLEDYTFSFDKAVYDRVDGIIRLSVRTNSADHVLERVEDLIVIIGMMPIARCIGYLRDLMQFEEVANAIEKMGGADDIDAALMSIRNRLEIVDRFTEANEVLGKDALSRLAKNLQEDVA